MSYMQISSMFMICNLQVAFYYRYFLPVNLSKDLWILQKFRWLIHRMLFLKRPFLYYFESTMSKKYCSENVMITNAISLAQRLREQLNTFRKSILYLLCLRIIFIRLNCALPHRKGRIWPLWTFHKSEGRDINCHIFRQSRHVIYMSRPKILFEWT